MKILRAIPCAWCGNILFAGDCMFIVHLRGRIFATCPNGTCGRNLTEANQEKDPCTKTTDPIFRIPADLQPYAEPAVRIRAIFPVLPANSRTG